MKSRSKLSPAMVANIKDQLRVRERVIGWDTLARMHRISRRNLLGHVNVIRRAIRRARAHDRKNK
jgi:hypothetical protein